MTNKLARGNHDAFEKVDLSHVRDEIAKQRDTWMDAPIESDKWRNLWFAKDGRNWFGDLIYLTKEDAKKSAKNWLINNKDKHGPIPNAPPIYNILDISHVIQMSVKE